MRRPRWIGAVGLAFALAALPAVATAHPLGNFSINHYAGVTVSPERVVVDLVVDTAEIPTLAVMPALDRDRNGSVDDAELENAAPGECGRRASELSVVVDGRPIVLALDAADLDLVPGAGGLETLRTTCGLHGELGHPIVSATTLTVIDAGDPDRLGWRDIVVRGDRLGLADPAVAIDSSSRLTDYPDDLLDRPLDERSLTTTLTPGAIPTTAAPSGDPPGAQARGDGVTTVDFRDLSLAVALLGLVLAATSGAGHALTPGHGKTLMAAYLVGSRGRPRDALVLAAAVTLSHTAGVLVLSAAVLLAGSTLPADRLYPVLSAVSGAIVIAIGAWLLIGCLRRRRAGSTHTHDHEHPHPHSHPHPRSHRADSSGVGRASLLAVGLAGGMIPSPAALVLLLGAIAAQQPAYGLLLALAFGLGMAGVMVALGLLIVHGRARAAALSHRLPVVGRLAPAVPWLAALVVLAGGLALTGGAVATVV